MNVLFPLSPVPEIKIPIKSVAFSAENTVDRQYESIQTAWKVMTYIFGLKLEILIVKTFHFLN